MHRWLVFVLVLVCLPALARARPNVPVRHRGAPTCLHGTAYADGCPAAVTTAAQFPLMLNGYAARPPWNVAAVDYYVGIPAGTSLTGANVAGMPAGCAYSATGSTDGTHPAVTCSSGTPTLNAIDFGVNNGVQLRITGGSVTVTNSRFTVGSNIPVGTGGHISTAGNSNFTMTNCEINGANVAVTAQAGQTVNVSSTGTITWKYNYFHNSGGDMADFNTGTRTEIIEFNLFKDIGVNTQHSDTLQWYNSVQTNAVISFNTVYLTVVQPGAGNGAFTLVDEGGGSITGANWGNNTVVAAVAGVTNWITGMYMDTGSTGSNVNIHDWYIDASGITAMWLVATGFYGDTFANPMSISNMMNMTTGSVYSAWPTSGSFYVVPDANGYTPSLNGSGSGCPYSGTAGVDGCTGAPAGSAQYPSLLSSYGSNRPARNVPGVDYFVGVPAGSLLDPSTAGLPSGCSFSSSTVTCSGNNITVSGFDFSLHNGMKLIVNGAATGLTISGNKFALAPNCSDPVVNINIGGTTTITKNTFDGGGSTCGTLVFGTMINLTQANGSTVTLTYNYYLNTPQDATDHAGPGSGSATVVSKFNLFYKQGWQGHPDGIQFCGGNFSGVNVSYNMYYTDTSVTPYSAPQPIHIEAQCTSAISNSTVAYNTIATKGTCNGGGSYPTGCSTNYDIACKQDSGSNTNTGFSSYGNYIDWTGAIAAQTNAYSCTGTTWGSPAANIDMSTGAVLTTAP